MLRASLGHTLQRHPVLRWLLGVLALLLLVLAVCEIAGWPFLRQPLARTLSDTLQRDVALGEHFRLRLLGSVRLEADALSIGTPPELPVVHNAAGQPQPFLDARDARLVLPYSTIFALMRGGERDRPLRIRALEVETLELGLARRADGTANWRFGAEDKEPRARPELPEFARLVVRNGRLRLDDTMTDLVLDAKLSTHEGQRTQDAQAGLEASAVGRYRGAPVRASLKTTGLLPLAAPADENAPTVPLQLELHVGDTHLQLDGRGRDLLKLTALDAAYRLSGPSLADLGTVLGLTLPDTPPPFKTHGRVRKAGDVWSAQVEALELGSSRVAGELRYDPRQALPLLSGKLDGRRLALEDLGPAFGADGNNGKPDRTPNRVLPTREFNLPALSAMNADIAVRIGTVDLGTPAIDVLAPLEGRLRLDGGVLAIDNLLARSAGGELRGALSLDARSAAPRWSGDLRWSGIRLDRFIKPRNPTAGGAGFISGVLGGRAKLVGVGRSTAAMLGSLDGSAELWIREGRVSSLLIELAGIDLFESLGVAIAGDDGVPIGCAVTRLTVKNGIVAPDVAVIDTPDTTVTVTGNIALDSEQLHLIVNTRPKDFSLVSLRSPVRIGGTFAKPQVQLDVAQIGVKVAAAAALAAIAAPLAGLLALADLGEEQRAVCQQALQQMKAPPPSAAGRGKGKR